MAPLKNLAEKIFGGDFEPASVFPSLDVNGIAARLKLKRKGRKRGEQKLPGTEDAGLDSVEFEIINEIEKLRGIGINNFEEHKSTYARRLHEIDTRASELKLVAEKAETDYDSEVRKQQNVLNIHKSDFLDHDRERMFFMQQNKLHRTAREKTTPINFYGTVVFMILFEAIGNVYFFASENPSGLFGAYMIALLVSFLNVAVSSLGGIGARNLVHVSVLRKMAGIFIFVVFVLIIAALNLGTAHFRDALGSNEWRLATIEALGRLQETPFRMETLETWGIVLLGAIVSIIAFVKARGKDDPYPGYGEMQRRWERARAKYVNEVSEAVDELTELRDEAIDALRQEKTEVLNGLRATGTIFEARRSLIKNFMVFLENVERSTNGLLSVYRDENRAARSTPAPAHFNEPFRFEKSPIAEPQESAPETAQHEMKKLEVVVDGAIETILGRYGEAVAAFEALADITETFVQATRNVEVQKGQG